MAWLVWTALIATVIALIGFSTIQVRVHFNRESENDHLSIRIRALYGLIKYKLEVPYLNFKSLWKGFSIRTERANMNEAKLVKDTRDQWTPDKIKDRYHNYVRLIRHVQGFDEWLWKTLSRVRCTELQWTTRIGLDDAADTAVSVGVLWGLKTTLLRMLFQRIRLEDTPRLAVEPQYNRTVFMTSVMATVEIRSADALRAGFLFVLRILRVKGGAKTWQSILFKT